MKVLVVDDDPVILEVAQAVLKGLGHDVSTRSNAFGTSVVILNEKPDVALIDLGMPGLPGEELVRIAGKDDFDASGHRTTFIFYSGREREELDRIVLETGVAGAIDKASGPAGLARQFSEIVGRL